MSTVAEIDLPKDVRAALQAVGYTPERVRKEALQHYAGILYARKTLTMEQAARLADMPMWDFIPFLGEQGIAVADYDEEEIATEMETVRWLTSNSQE